MKTHKAKRSGKEKSGADAPAAGGPTGNEADKTLHKAPSDSEGRTSDLNDDKIVVVNVDDASNESGCTMAGAADGNLKSGTKVKSLPLDFEGTRDTSGAQSECVADVNQPNPSSNSKPTSKPNSKPNSKLISDPILNPNPNPNTPLSTKDTNPGHTLTQHCVVKGDTPSSLPCVVKDKMEDTQCNGDSEGRAGQVPSAGSACHGCRSLKRLVAQVRLDRRSYILETRMLRKEMRVLRDHIRMILQPIPHTYLQPFHDFPPTPAPLSAVNVSGASPSSDTRKRPRSPERSFDNFPERGQYESDAFSAEGPPHSKSRPKKWLGTESLLDQNYDYWGNQSSWQGQYDYEGGGAWEGDQYEGWGGDGDEYWAGDWGSRGKPRRGALGRNPRYTRGKGNFMSNRESKAAELETRGMRKLTVAQKISSTPMESPMQQVDPPCNASMPHEAKKTEVRSSNDGTNASAGQATEAGGTGRTNDGSAKEQATAEHLS